MGHLYAFRILDDYFDQQEDGATAKEVSGRNFGSTRARVSASYRRLRLVISPYASITPIRTPPPTARMSQNAGSGRVGYPSVSKTDDHAACVGLSKYECVHVALSCAIALARGGEADPPQPA